MAKFVKVLLVERNAQQEEFITDELSLLGDLYVVGTCSTPAQVFTFLRCNRESPDIIFLDSQIDERGGFHLSRWLAKHYPDCVLIAMVQRHEYHSIRMMAGNGINDHIYKDDGVEIFSEVIEKYRRGSYAVQHTDGRFIMTDLGSQIAVPVPHEQDNILTDHESEILMMVVNQLSTKEIADIMSISPAEISETIDRVYKKTNSHSNLELRRFIIRHLSL